jgi:hypothetical protein
MRTAMILALQAAAAQPAPEPGPATEPGARYVTVTGVEAGAMKVLAALAEAPDAALRLVPADGAPPPFERCSDTPRARMYRLDSECIRALVPETPGGPPVIALAVVENRRSNITGRVVLKGHTIYCIGPRAVGFEDLNDPLDRLTPPQIGVRAKVDECIADSLSSERLEAMERAPGGGALWRFPWTNDRLAASAQEARGSAHGIAALRIDRFDREGGECRVRATVEEVEQGPGLRAGDAVEIGLPRSCLSVHPAATLLARPGARLRFYGAWGGGVRFVEPLVEPAR